MTPYEIWLKMCDEFTDADNELKHAVNAVTASMVRGASGMPSDQDLDAMNAASERHDRIRKAMDDFIAKTFGR